MTNTSISQHARSNTRYRRQQRGPHQTNTARLPGAAAPWPEWATWALLGVSLSIVALLLAAIVYLLR